MNIKMKSQSKLFDNTFLERLTRTHISIPITLFLCYAITLFYWSVYANRFSWTATVLLYLVGLVVFSWVEYQVHRRIFHLTPKTERRQKLQYTIHGVHHAFPKDKDRLAMPPLLSIGIATALLVVTKSLIGVYAFGFLSGFFTGYAGYLLVHYILHVFAPPKNFFRALWVNHAVHHYKDPNKAFGVSSPLWDIVYNTYR